MNLSVKGEPVGKALSTTPPGGGILAWKAAGLPTGS